MLLVPIYLKYNSWTELTFSPYLVEILQKLQSLPYFADTYKIEDYWFIHNNIQICKGYWGFHMDINLCCTQICQMVQSRGYRWLLLDCLSFPPFFFWHKYYTFCVQFYQSAVDRMSLGHFDCSLNSHEDSLWTLFFFWTQKCHPKYTHEKNSQLFKLYPSCARDYKRTHVSIECFKSIARASIRRVWRVVLYPNWTFTPIRSGNKEHGEQN